MPHIFKLLTPEGEEAVAQQHGPGDQFDFLLATLVKGVFMAHTGEVMEYQEEIFVHPAVATSSMPVALGLVVVAWANPLRLEKEDIIRLDLQDNIKTLFPGGPTPTSALKFNLFEPLFVDDLKPFDPSTNEA